MCLPLFCPYGIFSDLTVSLTSMDVHNSLKNSQTLLQRLQNLLGHIVILAFLMFQFRRDTMNYSKKKTGFNLYQSRHCAYITYSVNTWFYKILSVTLISVYWILFFWVRLITFISFYFIRNFKKIMFISIMIHNLKTLIYYRLLVSSCFLFFSCFHQN